MTRTPQPSIPTSEASPSSPQWVTIARIVRPQGRKGELLSELLTDFPERFAERRRLFLRAAANAEPREVRLERHWLHKGRLVLKLEGVDSIEAAEPLRGHDVVIPRAERAPLDEESVYVGDLVGCILYDRTTGTDAGEILDVDRESSNTALIVVRRPGASDELLIPFAKAYQPQIDLEGRRMEMSLPPGLLALNDPLTAEERLAMAAAQQDNAEPTPGSPKKQKKRS